VPELEEVNGHVQLSSTAPQLGEYKLQCLGAMEPAVILWSTNLGKDLQNFEVNEHFLQSF
jgi:hypothetical protein